VSILDKLKIIVSILAGLWAVLKGAPQAVRLIKRLLDGVTTVEQLGLQFQNNGGSSFKDGLDRLESLMIIERERNRAVSTMLPAGMFEADEDGLITWVSSKYTELTGLSLIDAVGWNWSARIHQDDRPRAIQEWTSAISQQRRAIINYRIHTEHGDRHVMVETFPVPNGDKCIGHIGLVCLIR
jgi:PAS domain S-box-containing protein